MFQRRHYVAVAALISNAGIDPDAKQLMVGLFIKLFQADNYNFNPTRFIAATGISE